MSAPWSSARVLALREVPTAAPGLRFAVRFVGGPAEGGDRDGLHHDADLPHPLAGTGKLFLAVAVARLAEHDPGLLSAPLTIRGEHRAVARSGTFRRMSGELQLTVDDAMALIVGTGDGACVAALLELFEASEEDVLAEARRAVAELGLAATAFTRLELYLEGGSDDRTEGSWGEGLLGTTTPADLCELLVQLVEASSYPAVAERVVAWMGMAFEPAGLASVLPGFGPRTIPHRTVSGLERSTPTGTPGCASVLILPADVGTGRPTACVAAYQPRTRADGSELSAREVSAVLGSLGLATTVSRG